LEFSCNSLLGPYWLPPP